MFALSFTIPKDRGVSDNHVYEKIYLRYFYLPASSNFYKGINKTNLFCVEVKEYNCILIIYQLSQQFNHQIYLFQFHLAFLEILKVFYQLNYLDFQEET